ncbi:glycosyltransferase family 25 protein [Glaesserella parasuis]|uniref:glycosyltransferase family 25 protein n=1 Tax=Glaesserella parasuis TaxID=738 RepID=UPI003852E5DC
MIFIINLSKSIERKEFIKSQFSKLKENDRSINYEFFPAINGKDNPNFYLFDKYNEKKRFIRKGNVMSLSQLGCFASHYLLWEKCIELNTGIIILEDDAILQNNFLDIYKFCGSDSNQSEFFWLSPPAFETLKGNEKIKIDNANKLIRFTGKHDNATGYYLTPKAAKKLLDHCQEWIYEVDITMDRFWENHLDILNVAPPCIKPSFEFNTNIDVDKNKKNRTLKIKLGAVLDND